MLIIARHGVSDTSKYHNLPGLKAAAQSGADIVTFAIRLTRDNHLVLARYAHLQNDRRQPHFRKLSLKELRRHTAGSRQPIVTLDEALKAILGTIYIQIEIAERAAVLPLLAQIQPFLRRTSDWEMVLFSSESPRVLSELRKNAPHANLALIHRHNPLSFLAWHPSLQLSAIGLHRLYVNSVVIEAAHKLDLLVYAYTVDRVAAAKKLEVAGVDAIMTDNPEKFLKFSKTNSK